MTNHEFLVRLEDILKDELPQEDLEDVLAYHREYFAEAGEGAAAELDTPEVVAQRILDEHLGSVRGRRRGKLPNWAIAVIIVAVLAVALLVTLLVWQTTDRAFQRIFGDQATRVTVATDQVTISSWDNNIAPGTDEIPVEDSAVTVSGTEDHPIWEVEPAAFSSLKVEVGMANVEVQSGDAWGLYLEWYEDVEPLTYEYDAKRSRLVVTGKQKHIGVSKTKKGGTVVVTVPAGAALEEVDVEAGMGSIALEDANLSVAELNTGMGDVTMTRCTVEVKADGESGMGNVNFDGACWGELDLSTGMGDVTAILTGADLREYELDLESGLGTVKLNGEKVRGPYKTSGGRYKLDAESGMGDVAVYFKEN